MHRADLEKNKFKVSNDWKVAVDMEFLETEASITPKTRADLEKEKFNDQWKVRAILSI